MPDGGCVENRAREHCSAPSARDAALVPEGTELVECGLGRGDPDRQLFAEGAAHADHAAEALCILGRFSDHTGRAIAQGSLGSNGALAPETDDRLLLAQILAVACFGESVVEAVVRVLRKGG